MSIVYIKEAGVDEIAVASKFEELMKTATGPDSAYIRAKESMLEYFNSAQVTEREKAEMLTKLVGDMSARITGEALNAAIKIESDNRTAPYAITKMREETMLVQAQRAKLLQDELKTAKEIELVDQQIKGMVIDGWTKQSAMEKNDGVILDNLPTLDVANNMRSSMILDKGTKWEQAQQTKMSVYATLAKSYRESGTVTWTVDDTSNKITTISDLDPANPGLTRRQEYVSIRQRQAFDDNKVQHAANSSANMIGLLLSASDSGAITAEDVGKWRSAVDELNSPTPINEGGF